MPELPSRLLRCGTCGGRFRLYPRILGRAEGAAENSNPLVLEWPSAHCHGAEMGIELDERGRNLEDLHGPIYRPPVAGGAPELEAPPATRPELDERTPRIVPSLDVAHIAGVPLGTVAAHPWDLGPAWIHALECDGRPYNPQVFPELAALLEGLSYEPGHLPDLRYRTILFAMPAPHNQEKDLQS